MAIRKQFVVFMKSKEGALAQLTRDLGREKLNLIAISAPDASGFGTVRFLVDEPSRARRILERRKYTYATEDVITIVIQNKPGGLANLARDLANAGIDIKYVYGSATDIKGKAFLVLGVDEPKVANQIAR
jgi:hypothetical protein